MTTIEMRNVSKRYRLRSGLKTTTLTAVDNASFKLDSGRTIALVGQSGSGKSTIAKMLLGLEKPSEGSILVDGEKIGSGRAAQTTFRRTVQMVFQDPYASLNPFHTVAHHVARPLKIHHPHLTKAELRAEVLRLLDRVRLTPAEDFADRLPGELSGGQRQRVAIARALAPKPGILIADEPVSALDVSIRLGVLQLLARLQYEEDLGVLYITHDMATARHFSDEIMVMRAGSIVETGEADQVILNPQHSYTKTLINAAPDPDRRLRELTRKEQ